MGVREKELLRVDLTNKTEKVFTKAMDAKYGQAYSNVKKTVQEFYFKYAGDDGKINPYDAMKLNRATKLERQVLSEISGLNNKNQLKSYLTDQYTKNYFYEGFILESEYQTKLGFQELNKNKIYQSILTPINDRAVDNLNLDTEIRFKRAITSVLASGGGVNKMASELKKSLNIGYNNALRIARTSTTSIMGEAAFTAQSKLNSKLGGLLEKEWISALDDRTRESHASLDGERVPVDKPFSNGLMFVGDPSGPPEEIINCRCVQGTAVKGYDSAGEFRRARGVDGKNEVIPYKNYKDWEKERITKAPVTEKTYFSKKERDSFENEIKNSDIEKVGVFDSSGKQIMTIIGDKESVEFTAEQAGNLKGNTLTHNHPGGGTFSLPDIKSLSKYQMKEIRAVDQDYIYIAKSMPGIKDEMQISNAFNTKYQEKREALWDKLDAGEITMAQVPEWKNQTANAIWAEISNEIGIDYQKTKR